MTSNPAASVLGRIGLTAVVVASLLILSPRRALAADIHVPGDYPTIQQALDASVPGDRILVDAGTYQENLDFHGKDVVLTSTTGAALTILDAPGGTGVLIGPGGIFQGFTVTGAVNSFGAGMAVSGTGTLVRNNVFDGNVETAGGYGAAIGGNVASPTINANLFVNNSCDTQFLSGVVAFINGSSPRITNNIFAHNPCRGINMTLPNGTNPLVANNTFVDNPAAIRVDARVDTESQVYRNNVLSGNDIGLFVEFLVPGNEPTWEYNLVNGNGTDYFGIDDQTGMNGNISEPPQFKAPGQGDYHLKPPSPAIDAGTNVSGLKRDYDGRRRPVDGNGDGSAEFDMGAYEFQPHLSGGPLGGPPPIPPVLSATELAPVQQNALIKGRDGIQSGLFGDTSYWTFGDTILAVPGYDGDSWADNSLSWTTDLNASDGIVLSGDYLDRTGAPTEFLPLTKQERRFNRLHDPDDCHEEPCGAEYALWAGPVVPDQARDRILYFYIKIYRVIGVFGWTTMGTGIAVGPPGGRVVRPIESPGSSDPTLMFLGDEVGFGGSGSFVEGDTLYSYGCYPGFFVQYCQLAQAPLASALDRSTWTFYAGNETWSPDIADAVTVFEGGAVNEVSFVPYLGVYVDIYSAPLSDDVMYRVSYTPWGPWSDQALLFTGVPGPGVDYAALSHPEYGEGGGQTQYVTYVHGTGSFQSEIRLVQVVFGQP